MGDVNLSILLGTIKWTGSREAETTWYLGASGWAKKLCYFDFWNFEIMRFAGTVSYFCLDIPFFFPKALPQGLHITWCRSSSTGTSIVWIQNLKALKMNDFALYILVQFPLGPLACIFSGGDSPRPPNKVGLDCFYPEARWHGHGLWYPRCVASSSNSVSGNSNWASRAGAWVLQGGCEQLP